MKYYKIINGTIFGTTYWKCEGSAWSAYGDKSRRWLPTLHSPWDYLKEDLRNIMRPDQVIDNGIEIKEISKKKAFLEIL